MIDIETLGLEPGCVVLSIGAVEFGAGEMGEQWYRSISRESCEAAGLTVDDGTLEWWQDQPEQAREVLTGGDELAEVLKEFAGWISGADEVWANSPSFDCEVLIEAGKAVGVPMPWEYHEERDFRTLSDLALAPEVVQDGVEHDALDDAKHQAHVAAATLRRIEAAAVDGDEELADDGEESERLDACEWPECDSDEDLRLCSTTDENLRLCQQCRSQIQNIRVISA